MVERLFDFYRELKKDGIIFCFSGPTSQSVVEGIGEALRHKLELEETAMTVSQRVFSIFVEQMQNVVNYSAEKVPGAPEEGGDMRHGIVVVGKHADAFFILCGNYIDQAETTRITAMLDHLNSMDKEQLKVFYKEQRRAERAAGSKGGGLGLIETARKASRPLEYRVVNVDARLNFLAINAVI